MKDMIKVAQGIYLVHTQAGFIEACKEEFPDDWEMLQGEEIVSYPNTYPSLISLSLAQIGSHYHTACNSISIDNLMEEITTSDNGSFLPITSDDTIDNMYTRK